MGGRLRGESGLRTLAAHRFINSSHACSVLGVARLACKHGHNAAMAVDDWVGFAEEKEWLAKERDG
jgi:hypothetical protein